MYVSLHGSWCSRTIQKITGSKHCKFTWHFDVYEKREVLLHQEPRKDTYINPLFWSDVCSHWVCPGVQYSKTQGLCQVHVSSFSLDWWARYSLLVSSGCSEIFSFFHSHAWNWKASTDHSHQVYQRRFLGLIHHEYCGICSLWLPSSFHSWNFNF